MTNKTKHVHKILTDGEHNLLNNPQLLDSDIYTEKSRREKRSQIRKKVRNALQELTNIIGSKEFIENDANRNLVFTRENLVGFFLTLFKLYPSDFQQSGKKDLKTVSQERLLKLSQTIIDDLGFPEFAQRLTGDLYQLLGESTNETSTMLGIHALYLARTWRTVEKFKHA